MMIVRNILSILCFSQLTLCAFSQPIKNTVEGNNAFAFELFKNILNDDKNTFLSPYSISSALAMTYAGARGETERQMSKVLHYDLNQINTHQEFFEINSSLSKYQTDTIIKLSIANALWKSESWPFKQEFLDLTKKYYEAAIYPLKGIEPINDWAKLHTNGKITNIVEETDLINAVLVLTNAIYFKGDWLTSFKESDTRKEQFIISKNNIANVDMMFQENELNYFEDEQNQVIELPYKGETMSMTFILPKENSSIMEPSNKIEKLYSNYISKLFKVKVKIFIPKFSFTSEFHLEKVLPEMGMPYAFGIGSNADFSRMSEAGLKISKVIHKAFIEVNEKGSEAAAVTAVIMTKEAVIRDIIFKANRPFIILITDKQTGSILFMGSILNPNQQ